MDIIRRFIAAFLALSLSAAPVLADSDDDDTQASSQSSSASSTASSEDEDEQEDEDEDDDDDSSSSSSESSVVTDESYADDTEEELRRQGIEVPPGWARMSRAEKLRIIRNRQLRRIRHRMEQRENRRGEQQDDDSGSSSSRPFGHRRLPGNPKHSSERLFEANDMEKPEGWEEWSIEEQKEYLEENDLRLPPGMLVRERVLDLLRSARDGERYRAFSGNLRPKKMFSDENRIRNKDAVEFLQRRGILDGNDDGSFNPQGPINRAESLKVLLEALGDDGDEDAASSFSDVPRGAWFAKYVGRARMLGIVNGYSDGSFKPGQTVNQAELLKIAFESFGIDLTDYPVTDLPAGVDPEAWFAPYLQYALDNDLLDEEDVNLAGGMTREMFSELIYRLIQQQEGLEQE